MSPVTLAPTVRCGLAIKTFGDLSSGPSSRALTLYKLYTDMPHVVLAVDTSCVKRAAITIKMSEWVGAGHVQILILYVLINST